MGGRGSWEVGSACLVSLVGASFWDERGEEGADKGPHCSEKAQLGDSSSSFLQLLLRSIRSDLFPSFIIINSFIHQTFLARGDGNPSPLKLDNKDVTCTWRPDAPFPGCPGVFLLRPVELRLVLL